MSQTTVTFAPTQALSGLIIQSILQATGKNVEASAEFPFGIGVVSDLTKATDTQAVKLPTGSTDRLAGIVSFQYTSQDFLGTTGITPTSLCSLLQEGTAWVSVENAVTKGNRAFMRITASGGNTQLGRFRSDADTATAVECKGIEFLTTTTGAGLAQVRISVSANRAGQA